MVPESVWSAMVRVYDTGQRLVLERIELAKLELIEFARGELVVIARQLARSFVLALAGGILLVAGWFVLSWGLVNVAAERAADGVAPGHRGGAEPRRRRRSRRARVALTRRGEAGENQSMTTTTATIQPHELRAAIGRAKRSSTSRYRTWSRPRTRAPASGTTSDAIPGSS